MKKLLVFALVAMVAGFAGAQTLEGIANSYVYDVSNNTWYQASGTNSWATGGAFQGDQREKVLQWLLKNGYPLSKPKDKTQGKLPGRPHVHQVVNALCRKVYSFQNRLR